MTTPRKKAAKKVVKKVATKRVAMKRPDTAAQVCRNLSADVRRVAPPGLDHVPDVWPMVAEASDAFLDELHRWVEDGDRARVDRVRGLYDAVLDAWREVAAQHTGPGRALEQFKLR